MADKYKFDANNQEHIQQILDGIESLKAQLLAQVGEGRLPAYVAKRHEVSIQKLAEAQEVIEFDFVWWRLSETYR